MQKTIGGLIERLEQRTPPRIRFVCVNTLFRHEGKWCGEGRMRTREADLITTLSRADQLLTEQMRRADEVLERVWRMTEPGADQRVDVAGRAGQGALDLDVMETVERLVTTVAHSYLDGGDQWRSRVVSLMSDTHSLQNYMTGYVHLMAMRIAATGDSQALRLGLAAVAMADLDPDYRDFYVAVGHLYAEGALMNRDWFWVYTASSKGVPWCQTWASPWNGSCGSASG